MPTYEHTSPITNCDVTSEVIVPRVRGQGNKRSFDLPNLSIYEGRKAVGTIET